MGLQVSCDPFGISTASGEYQARMTYEILQDYYLNGAIVYIDDTVIYGSTIAFPNNPGSNLIPDGRI